MAIPAELYDAGRDALALVAAQARGDEEAAQVLVAECDTPQVTMLLAGMVVGVLELGGADPEAWIARCQEQLLAHG